MNGIERLMAIRDHLMGPEGCPWDQEQTLEKIREDLLEEACEVIDAIMQKDARAIQEEAGDLLFVVLFICKLAEKEGYTDLEKIAHGISDKLILRHPHVFKEKKQLTTDELLVQWDQIKQQGKEIKNPFQKIPKALPALSRAYEILKISQKQEIPLGFKSELTEEEKFGKELFEVVKRAREKKIDPELALRKYLISLGVV